MVNTNGRTEGGWTFLEVVVSLGILTVLLGSLFSAQSHDFRWLGDALDEAVAERAAAARIESLLGGRERPVAGSRALVADSDLAEALPGVRLEETVRETVPGLFAVEVRLRWRGAGTEERAYTLATLVAGGAGR